MTSPQDSSDEQRHRSRQHGDRSGDDDQRSGDDDQRSGDADQERARSRKIRNLVIGGGVVVAIIVVAAVFLFGGQSGANLRDYIEGHYTRAATLDVPAAHAYTSNEAVNTVADEVSHAVKPVDMRSSTVHSSQNGGKSVFLQYGNDIVALFPHDGGTKIMLSTNYHQAYNYYYIYVGGWWPSRPHYSGN